MRTAFGFAAIACGLAVAARLLDMAPWSITILDLAAAGLMALWIAHLIAYAIRSASRLGRETVYQVEGSVAFVNLGERTGEFSRRQFLWTGVKAFALAAFVTAFPAGISRAQTACTVTSCSDPNCSCAPPTPQCVFCPNRSETGCIPSAAVGCCSNYAFWYCLNGTQCNGDGTYTPYCR